MRKMMVFIMIIIIIMFIGGCQSTYKEAQAAGDTPSMESKGSGFGKSTALLDKNSQLDYLNNDLRHDQEKFLVSPSVLREGWQKISAKVYLNKIDSFEGSDVLIPLGDNRMIDFSVHVPKSWSVEDHVLNAGSKQKKIAELFPVVLLDFDEELKFLNFDQYTDTELISKETVQINGITGHKTILRVTDTETWYMHNYYLTDGSYGFGISLYSYIGQVNNIDVELFDEIVGTFSLCQPFV